MDSAPSNDSARPPRLPEEPPCLNAPENTSHLPAAGERGRVLIVDDDTTQQMLSRLQLKRLGCAATTASSGEEAVAHFESAAQANNPAPFDLVLMDLIMQGMDGLAACRAIRKLYPRQHLVIVSGYTPGAHAEEIARLGIIWLVKPYTIAELANTVRAIIQTPPPHPATQP